MRAPETFQHQSPGREQDHRERHLRDHQSRTRALLVQAIAAPTRTFVQGERERAAFRDAPGRPDSHEDTGNDRDRDGEPERGEIDPGFLETRDGCRTEREDRVETPDGEKHSGDRPEQGEDGAFGQHLPRQSPAARAERAAYRQFSPAHEHSRELQVRHVRARDQQHAPDRAEQQIKTLPVSADGRFQKQLGRDSAARVRFRIFLLERNRDRLEIGAGLFQSYSRFQPAERAETGMIIAKQNTRLDSDITKRHVDFGEPRKAHRGWEHADDFAGDAIDHDLLAEHFARRAKTAAPHFIADQRDLPAVRHVVGLCKIAAELRRHSKNGQEIRGHPPAADAFRRRVSFRRREIVGLAPEKSQVGETVLRRAPIEKIQVTDGTGRERRRAFPDADQAFRMRIRQRPEEDRIDHAEDRGVRPDPERESEDGQGREPRRFPNHAKRVTDVAE